MSATIGERRARVAALTLLALLAGLSGCNAGPVPEGLWSNSYSQISFYEDGTAILEERARPRTYDWRMLADDRFVLTIGSGSWGSLYGCKAKDLLKLRSFNDGRVHVFYPGPRRQTRYSYHSVLDLERSSCEP